MIKTLQALSLPNRISILLYSVGMSFRITEEYVQAAIALEHAGYEWSPGPGDWILDKDDQSIGLLTTPVEKQWLMRRLNTHLPTNVQVDELLTQHGIIFKDGEVAVSFVHSEGFEQEVDKSEYTENPGLARLVTLTNYLKQHPRPK